MRFNDLVFKSPEKHKEAEVYLHSEECLGEAFKWVTDTYQYRVNNDELYHRLYPNLDTVRKQIDKSILSGKLVFVEKEAKNRPIMLNRHSKYTIKWFVDKLATDYNYWGSFRGSSEEGKNRAKSIMKDLGKYLTTKSRLELSREVSRILGG